MEEVGREGFVGRGGGDGIGDCGGGRAVGGEVESWSEHSVGGDGEAEGRWWWSCGGNSDIETSALTIHKARSRNRLSAGDKLRR